MTLMAVAEPSSTPGYAASLAELLNVAKRPLDGIAYAAWAACDPAPLCSLKPERPLISTAPICSLIIYREADEVLG